MKTYKSHANWQKNLKKSNRSIELDRPGKELENNFSSKFENGIGLIPGKLITETHAECFLMAFSGSLTNDGYESKSIESTGKALSSLEVNLDICLI